MAKGLQTLYLTHQKAELTGPELRAYILYELLEKGIKPWEWDTQHYSGDNADMIGWFYPEDIANILGIKKMERLGGGGGKLGL